MKNIKLQFERDNIERSLPPLNLTLASMKMSDAKTTERDSSARIEKPRKSTYQKTRSQTPKHQQRKIQHIKEKRKNSMYHRAWSQTQVHQNHRWANLIRPTTAIIKLKTLYKEELSETKETGPYQIMRKINGKVDEDRV